MTDSHQPEEFTVGSSCNKPRNDSFFSSFRDQRTLDTYFLKIAPPITSTRFYKRGTPRFIKQFFNKFLHFLPIVSKTKHSRNLQFAYIFEQ